MTTPQTAYQALEDRFDRIARIEDALGVLGWDTETMMPDGAATGRGKSMSVLTGISHELLVASAVSDWLDAAEEDREGLDGWQAENLAQMRRTWQLAQAVPSDLVAALAEATTAATLSWRRARADNDYGALRPHLGRVLDLVREVAGARGERLGLSPYDALLEEFQPGLRMGDVTPLFAELADRLPPLIEEIEARQQARPEPVGFSGGYDIAAQEALCRQLSEQAGFDRNRGRMDVSTHPFCGGAGEDVRITIRFDPGDPSKSLLGTLHETGHALYEQGRPAPWLHQPVGRSAGMAVHESQSLIIEMQACRSRDFLGYLGPLMADRFGGPAELWDRDNLFALFTRVRRSFIRVDADEATYPLHIILRTDLERALIDGSLSLDDLPGAWNAGMETLLGIVPPDDRLGCLQDIHWPTGGFGYFPTYTLGAVLAAQLFAAVTAARPGLRAALGRGDFSPLRDWLNQRIHGQGSALGMGALVRAATGEPLRTEAFFTHLGSRYLS